ncbi:hypothetical protein [Gymnodinialimonas sp. 57CJ19]|uniref:hypothetical protein n=1 Tax=Gymnodinialimonas sp. 57CJ19 TaxID=3138498 RepID=UPI0031346345
MSRHAPGSKDWWLETALIAGSGVALAAFLWDGPIFAGGDAVSAATPMVAPGPARAPAPVPVPVPRTVADLVDAGCLTQENLRAMVEGRTIYVACPLHPQDPSP